VHPAMAQLQEPKDVLVLGGGDGMAVRELLKYPSLKSITLVDLDKKMTDLFRTCPLLCRLNCNSLNQPIVHIVTSDAFVWLRSTNQRFDAAIVDFPDPSNFSLGKLYSQTFYRALHGVLRDHGLAVIQSTSPFYARNSYWCVVNTLKSAGFHTMPYHAYVPSFGDWGYVIGSISEFAMPDHFPAGLRYVTPDTVAQMLYFAPDMLPTVHAINRLNNQALVHLFESEWSEYAETH
jgi:spermidine synthase